MIRYVPCLIRFAGQPDLIRALRMAASRDRSISDPARSSLLIRGTSDSCDFRRIGIALLGTHTSAMARTPQPKSNSRNLAGLQLMQLRGPTKSGSPATRSVERPVPRTILEGTQRVSRSLSPSWQPAIAACIQLAMLKFRK